MTVRRSNNTAQLLPPLRLTSAKQAPPSPLPSLKQVRGIITTTATPHSLVLSLFNNMMQSRTADIVLRCAFAFAFLYPPFNALSDPNSWIGYFPSFVHGYVPDQVLLHGFGVIEVIIALWVLSGWKIVLPLALGVCMLLGIIAFNFSEFQVLFRDVSIAAIGVSLIITRLQNKNI
jgi:uncharacterized membrane protein YphA (DoxX/SURF4 family)